MFLCAEGLAARVPRKRLIAVLFMIVSVGLLQANDLRIEAFSATLMRNGTEVVDWDDLGYLPPSDTIEVKLHLKTSWACNGNVGDTCEDKPVVDTISGGGFYFQVAFYSQLTAVSESGSTYVLRGDKTYAILPSSLSYRYDNGYVSNEEDNRTVTIDDSGFTQWVAEQFYNGDTITFQITINSSETNHVTEDDYSNNTQADSVATLIPVSDSLKVTDQLLLPITTLYSANDNGGSACPVTLAAAGTWQPGTGWSGADYSLFGQCASIESYGSNGLNLKLIDSVYAGQTSGTIGGIDVVIPQSELKPDSGALPAAGAFMRLPDGNTFHERNVTTGRPVARGTRTVPVEGKNYVSTYDDLIVGNDFDAYLHTGVIPLYFHINLMEVDAGGLSGVTDDAVYVYNVAYAADDFRSWYGGAPSNDIFLAHPKSGEHTFAIDSATGLMSLGDALQFASGNGPTHFPKTVTGWEGFSAVITDSRLQISKTYGDFKMKLGVECGSCPTSMSAPVQSFEYNSIPVAMNGDGAIMATIDSLGRMTKWGTYNETSTHRFAFERDDGSSAAVLYFPGYEGIGTGGIDNKPVVAYLMGSRGAEVSSQGVLMAGTSVLADDDTARRGNGFMAGITVGPETYSDPQNNNQPAQGHGAMLTGNSMDVAFGGPSDGSHFYAIPSNAGNKYVIRPGGVTGAFNTDTVPGPNVYGFDLDLTRFAFRQVNNTIDSYTWIDGQFHVGAPGNSKGDFSIVFDSMQMQCSGHVDGAHVVRSDCTAHPDAPNCGETFAAWQTPIDLLNMAFKPQDSSLSVCTDQPRRLLVGNIVHLAALSTPLGMEAYWSSAGEPQEAAVTGDAGVEIDRPATVAGGEAHGFNVAFENGIALKTPKGTQITDGWFEINGSVAVPFWNALAANTRLANKTTTIPEQTIMRPKGTMLTLADDDRSNSELADQMKGHDFDAVYTWGNTGFGMSLPVYYESGRYAQNKNPQFLGEPVAKDYVVLNVNSGIDYIDSVRTKVSFGASADFETLRALNMDLHIDVSDPQSVERIDAFLCTIKGSLCSGGSGPVAGVIGSTLSRLDLLNQVAEAGMDRFFESGLREAIRSAVDAAPDNPFQAVSAAMVPIRSLNAEAVGIVADELTAISDRMIDPLSETLETKMYEIYNQVPSMLFDVASNRTALEEYKSDLELTVVKLAQAQGVIGDVQKGVDRVRDRFTVLNNSLSGRVNSLNSALDDMQTLLGNAVNTGCGMSGGEYDNKLLQRAFALKNRAEQTVDALDAIDLKTYGSLLGSVAGVDVDGLVSVEEQIRLQAKRVLVRLDAIETDMQNALGCGGSGTDYSGLLDGINQKINQFKSDLSQVESAVDSVQQAVIGANGYLDNTASALSQAAGKVAQANTAVTELKNTIEHALATESLEFLPPYNGAADASEIQSRMNTAMQSAVAYAWVDTAGKSFVSHLRAELKAPVDQAIANTSIAITTGLGPNISTFVQYDAKQLEWMAIDRIMNSPIVEEVNRKVYTMMSEAVEQVNELSHMAFDQVNRVIEDSVEAVSAKANEALASATGQLTGDIPLKSAKVDGYATIAGNNLERLHIGAEWTMSGDSEDSSSTYAAALDVTSWSSNGKGAACGVADANSTLDAKIAAMGLPISIGGSDGKIKEVYLGFMLEQMVPGGVFGGISIDGTLDFQAFQMYDLAFAAGMGSVENYIGASAGAVFEDLQMAAVFLVGKTCNADVLTALDPQVAEFIELPGGVFNGAYARGSASVPVWDNGCVLTVGVSADIGAWVLIGPPLTIGGLMGGGAYGKALCIASLRGQVLAMGQKSGDSYSFSGEGFGVAGIGFDCDPVTWTSVGRSRADSWCGTGDASFKATYKSGWSIDDLSTSAIY